MFALVPDALADLQAQVLALGKRLGDGLRGGVVGRVQAVDGCVPALGAGELERPAADGVVLGRGLCVVLAHVEFESLLAAHGEQLGAGLVGNEGNDVVAR